MTPTHTEHFKFWPKRLPAHTAAPQDTAIVPYTSGTTGLPKGCIHTHASIMHNAGAVRWDIRATCAEGFSFQPEG